MIDTLTGKMFMGLGVRRLVLAQGLVDERQAVLEAFLQGRGIEDDIADLLPQVALVLPADNADCALELLAAEPEFAVEWHVGQASTKPFGSMKEIAQPR